MTGRDTRIRVSTLFIFSTTILNFMWVFRRGSFMDNLISGTISECIKMWKNGQYSHSHCSFQNLLTLSHEIYMISQLLSINDFFLLLIIITVGRREPCSNEGEEVAVDAIKDMTCFKCICQVSTLFLFIVRKLWGVEIDRSLFRKCFSLRMWIGVFTRIDFSLCKKIYWEYKLTQWQTKSSYKCDDEWMEFPCELQTSSDEKKKMKIIFFFLHHVPTIFGEWEKRNKSNWFHSFIRLQYRLRSCVWFGCL